MCEGGAARSYIGGVRGLLRVSDFKHSADWCTGSSRARRTGGRHFHSHPLAYTPVRNRRTAGYAAGLVTLGTEPVQPPRGPAASGRQTASSADKRMCPRSASLRSQLSRHRTAMRGRAALLVERRRHPLARAHPPPSTRQRRLRPERPRNRPHRRAALPTKPVPPNPLPAASNASQSTRSDASSRSRATDSSAPSARSRSRITPPRLDPSMTAVLRRGSDRRSDPRRVDRSLDVRHRQSLRTLRAFNGPAPQYRRRRPPSDSSPFRPYGTSRRPAARPTRRPHQAGSAATSPNDTGNRSSAPARATRSHP
jgi:hypothetical protein